MLNPFCTSSAVRMMPNKLWPSPKQTS